MKYALIALAIFLLPISAYASAGYEATNFPTTEWNGEYCPTEDELNGYPIYENGDAISLYKNLTGPNTYWIIGVNPQDGYNPSDWYYYASPINGTLPTDYTYWRSLDDSNHNGDIAEFECGGGGGTGTTTYATSTEAILGTISLGLAIIITLIFIFVVTYVYNQFKPKKKWL